MKSSIKYTVKFTTTQYLQGTTFYTVQVIDLENGLEWAFKQRYSEMRRIHERSAATYKKQQLPQFPHKKIFNSNSPQFIQKRKKQLEHYYNTLLKSYDLQQFPQLIKLLETNKPKKEVTSKQNPKVDTPQKILKADDRKQLHFKNKLQEIFKNYDKLFLETSQEFYQNASQDNTKQKVSKKIQSAKLDLTSELFTKSVSQNLKLDKQNQFDFWTQYFGEALEDQFASMDDIEIALRKLKAQECSEYPKFVLAMIQ